MRALPRPAGQVGWPVQTMPVRAQKHDQIAVTVALGTGKLNGGIFRFVDSRFLHFLWLGLGNPESHSAIGARARATRMVVGAAEFVAIRAKKNDHRAAWYGKRAVDRTCRCMVTRPERSDNLPNARPNRLAPLLDLESGTDKLSVSLQGSVAEGGVGMSILVICPGCKAQFRVGDKNAGKQGPCPKCKTILTVPQVEEVKIHVPEEFSSGGKTASGKLATKPVTREKNKVSAVTIVGIGAAVVAVLFVAFIGGRTGLFANLVVSGVGTLAVAVPLSLAGYLMLRNDELEPYRGASLWIRVGICAAVYAALWLGFAFVPDDFRQQGWYWLFIPVPFLLIGTATAWGAFDFSPENAFFHYTLFLLLTLILRWVAGMPPVWSAGAAAVGAA